MSNFQVLVAYTECILIGLAGHQDMQLGAGVHVEQGKKD